MLSRISEADIPELPWRRALFFIARRHRRDDSHKIVFCLSSWQTAMSIAKEWRDHAGRLLARAQAARDRGESGLADLLTAAAMQYMDRAERAALEAEKAPPPASDADRDEAPPPQNQPKNRGDKE
jgi:hypothetical protein